MHLREKVGTPDETQVGSDLYKLPPIPNLNDPNEHPFSTLSLTPRCENLKQPQWL